MLKQSEWSAFYADCDKALKKVAERYGLVKAPIDVEVHSEAVMLHAMWVPQSLEKSYRHFYAAYCDALGLKMDWLDQIFFDSRTSAALTLLRN